MQSSVCIQTEALTLCKDVSSSGVYDEGTQGRGGFCMDREMVNDS